MTQSTVTKEPVPSPPSAYGAPNDAPNMPHTVTTAGFEGPVPPPPSAYGAPNYVPAQAPPATNIINVSNTQAVPATDHYHGGCVCGVGWGL
ncbi:hypothetical protein GOP47_0009390 [Adiantum capillus-veneris]|uniref:Uncharacterized protein n=1 Tax=Adiantum capillus-veneris TaxID=13818 RepID=A0A9D4UWT0_ADICA|nr:hypothetical protein GOP47_0009390 [Adiantum capillus-veneris]